MQWWNDFSDWITSPSARPVLFASAVLLVSLIVSGLLAAWIARGAVRGLLVRAEREQRASAVAALVDAAVEASVWNSLTPAEQVLSDRSVGQADILVRLLPVKSAVVAADWAAHQLAELKSASASHGYSLEPAIVEFRDRLVEWQNRPSRARRLFLADLERWRFERTSDEKGVLASLAEPDRQHAGPVKTQEDTRTVTTTARLDATATAPTEMLDEGPLPEPVAAYAASKPTGLQAD